MPPEAAPPKHGASGTPPPTHAGRSPSVNRRADVGIGLYGIYENGELCFNVSSEIVFDDYISYCSGNIALDELVSESDRKLSAYLNE